MGTGWYNPYPCTHIPVQHADKWVSYNGNNILTYQKNQKTNPTNNSSMHDLRQLLFDLLFHDYRMDYALRLIIFTYISVYHV
jgi:hypothetical protein